MIVRTLKDITDTDRDVVHNTWRSRRFVLANDKVGFSMHETVLGTGTVTEMWYKNHIEAVYVIGGRGRLDDLDKGESYALEPGTLYLLNEHDHHRITVEEDLRTVCVFNPPCTGREVHDEEGAYPLLTEEDEA